MSRLKAAVLFLAASGLTGCSYFSAQEQINQADQAFGQIERDGGLEKSPYHYYASREYLDRSRRENRNSDFVSAERFANRSLEHSSRALEQMGQNVGAANDAWSSEPVADDSWGTEDGGQAAQDSWGTDDSWSEDDSWGTDDGWAEPVEAAPTVEIVPVPMDDVEMMDEAGSQPDMVVIPDPEPGQADFVIEPVP